MTSGKISVIMPAYNAADYIEATINRIETQSYKNFELIIVNDGSEDATEKICEECANVYANVLLISQENAGPSKARETGLKMANGEYIAFVDADDYLDPQAFDKVISVFSNRDIDIVQFGCLLVDNEGNILSKNALKNSTYDSASSSFGYFISQKNCTNYLCNKIYKQTLFQGLEWPCLYYSEDYALLAQLYGAAQMVVTIEDFLYYYVQHSKSAVNKPFGIKKLDQIRAGEYVVDYSKKRYPEFLPEALNYVVTRAARLAVSALHSDVPNKKEIYRDMRNIFKQNIKALKDELKIQKRKFPMDIFSRMFLYLPQIVIILKR